MTIDTIIEQARYTIALRMLLDLMTCSRVQEQSRTHVALFIVIYNVRPYEDHTTEQSNKEPCMSYDFGSDDVMNWLTRITDNSK